MSSSIFGHMAASLRDYLADVSRRSQSGYGSAEIAQFEVPRIVAALRALLDEHQPDERGRCATCRRRRFGKSPSPCRAYLTAHLCLLVTEDDADLVTISPATHPRTPPPHTPARLAARRAPG